MKVLLSSLLISILVLAGCNPQTEENNSDKNTNKTTQTESTNNNQ